MKSNLKFQRSILALVLIISLSSCNQVQVQAPELVTFEVPISPAETKVLNIKYEVTKDSKDTKD